MNSAVDAIENKEALEKLFGYWPSFHDAEVRSIRLASGGAGGPSMEVDIHVFEMTSEITASGHYLLKNHTLVTLKFAHIELQSLKWFNHQNVLWGLEVAMIEPMLDEGPRFRVEMPSSHGCEVSLTCDHVAVIKVVPFVEVEEK